MNCKQGDLAFVKRGHFGFKNTGKIVEVVGPIWPDIGNGPEWTVRFPTPIELLDGTKSKLATCPDAWLIPIDTPDKDAVDEVIQRIGTPHKEAA